MISSSWSATAPSRVSCSTVRIQSGRRRWPLSAIGRPSHPITPLSWPSANFRGVRGGGLSPVTLCGAWLQPVRWVGARPTLVLRPGKSRGGRVRSAASNSYVWFVCAGLGVAVADRHRFQPLSVRLQGADREWVERHAAATGRSERMVIADAVIELRGRVEGRVPVGRVAGRVSAAGCASGLGWPL